MTKEQYYKRERVLNRETGEWEWKLVPTRSEIMRRVDPRMAASLFDLEMLAEPFYGCDEYPGDDERPY